VKLPGPARPVLEFFASPRGGRIDAQLLRLTGHSPYAYLYGMDMGRRGWRYRAPLALTTIGRRSGRLRTVGLAYYDVDDDRGDGDAAWAVVGSAGGSEVEPHWVRNVRDNPVAWVHLHRRTTAVLAAVLDGDAKRPIWDAITAQVPLFDSFQAGVQRDIPVVVLRPRRP
jgi:F420H(2)-dependent quinone reductase